VNKLFYRLGLVTFLMFGLFTQVLAQRQNPTATLQDMLSAGSQTITIGDVLLNETFDNSNAWEAYSDSTTNAKVGKGVYRMVSKATGLVWGINSQNDSDVVIQLDTLQNSSYTLNGYGVACRAGAIKNDGSGYYFRISGDGYYAITKSDGKTLTNLVDWTKSDAIHQGQNRNQITAVCVGSYLALYANGEFLAETTDDLLTEGYTALSVSAFEDKNKDPVEADVSFDNVVIYDASSGRGSGASITLKNYDGQSEDAIAELEDLGLIRSGAVFIFGENYAYFTGKGSFFTPLARRSPHKNIVMAGRLKFTIGNADKFESCVLTSRIKTDSNGTATTYIDTGFINDGSVYIFDRFSESQDGNYQLGADTYDLSEEHHILFTLINDKANVFVDGKLAIADFTVDERSGSYGISLTGQGSKAKCEGRDIWAYQLPA
jgi:hypothetical protein